ncbi:chromo domain-like protein [Neocallimastix lanati (nom. inval.)]|nr:chromo domain-like protein [Neocallimastix sp. JGI-2020a]
MTFGPTDYRSFTLPPTPPSYCNNTLVLRVRDSYYKYQSIKRTETIYFSSTYTIGFVKAINCNIDNDLKRSFTEDKFIIVSYITIQAEDNSIKNKTVNKFGRNQEPPPIVINNEEEYEVEQILDKRTHYGKIQYLIKWKGYPLSEASWEPEENLICLKLLKKFNKNN